MAGYKELPQANHKDIHTIILDDTQIVTVTHTPQSSTQLDVVDGKPTRAAQGRTVSSEPVPVAVVHELRAVPSNSPAEYAQSVKASIPTYNAEKSAIPSEPSGRGKVIVGSVAALATLSLLAAIAVFVRLRHRYVLERAPVAKTPSSPLEPYSTSSKADGEDLFKQRSEPGWVKIGAYYRKIQPPGTFVANNSPRTSIDSGLGIFSDVSSKDHKDQDSSPAPSSPPLFKTSPLKIAGFASEVPAVQTSHGPVPSPGPLTSHPVSESMFFKTDSFLNKIKRAVPSPAYPQLLTETQNRLTQSSQVRPLRTAYNLSGAERDLQQRQPEKSLRKKASCDIKTKVGFADMRDSAVTPQTSRETLGACDPSEHIEEMKPNAPRHREMSAPKSILKRSPPVTPQTSPGASPSDGAGLALRRGSIKTGSLRKVRDLLRKSKETSPEVAVQETSVSTEQIKRRKSVSFGESTVRRVSFSPERQHAEDEDGWETVSTVDSETSADGHELTRE